MQDFRTYDYQIPIKDLEDTVKEVIKHGYSVTIVINGEYYDVIDSMDIIREEA